MSLNCLTKLTYLCKYSPQFIFLLMDADSSIITANVAITIQQLHVRKDYYQLGWGRCLLNWHQRMSTVANDDDIEG